jgi:hypothetical protein
MCSNNIQGIIPERKIVRLSNGSGDMVTRRECLTTQLKSREAVGSENNYIHNFPLSLSFSYHFLLSKQANASHLSCCP